jgi:heptosyltransferase-2
VGRGVLVVRFSSLGDVVLTTPVLEALQREEPATPVVLLTRAGYAPLFREDPRLAEVWGWDSSRESFGGLAGRVRRAGFDRLIDLHGSLRSRLLAALAGTPVARLRKYPLRRALLVARPPFKRRRALPPVPLRYLEAAGLGGHDPRPRLHLPEAGRAAGREWGRRMRAGAGGRLVVLLTGARHPTKRWPAAHLLELGRRLQLRGDLPVLIPPPEGAPDLPLHDLAAAGIRLSPGLTDPAGLAGALGAADGAVANDSGPLHVAAAVGTPTVGLFGPTSPALGFAPLGERVRTLHLDLFCSPCSRHGRRRCRRERRFCLEDLSPEAVLAALDQVMASNKSRNPLIHKDLGPIL